jgi:diketogulonate reductase-like aldo/keto reductase
LTLSVQQNTEAWKTLETFVADGKIKHLGISNIYQPSLLRKMIDFATVPVDIVQNRWWEGNGWDWESEF